MSKIDLTSIDDKHMQNALVQQWLEIFKRTTGQLPTAIVVTLDQAKKWFLNAGQIADSYNGVPLEIEQDFRERPVIVKTINAILKGMHDGGVKEATDVYRLLEAMKDKISANNQGDQ